MKQKRQDFEILIPLNVQFPDMKMDRMLPISVDSGRTECSDPGKCLASKGSIYMGV